MKIAIIKKLNEKLPYWMKRPFARIIRNQLISNKVFLKQYEQLKKAEAMTEEERERLQFETLKQTIDHAYHHTAYYKDVMDRIGIDPRTMVSVDDIKRLPVLTKELIRENYEQLKSDDIDDFYDVRTSGTTGTPTHVLMERNAIYREWAFIYHYWSKFGYDFRTSKLATLRGVDLHQKLYEINPLYREIRLNVFSLNNKNIKEYVRLINRYGADFLYGYPSAVYNFCRLAKVSGIALAGRFKAVLLISENLYDFQESEIEEVLRCPVAMFYGHTERAVFAEKYDEGYLFQPLYGVTEIAQNGTLIVTGFINRQMPLIRYEVDDLVEQAEGLEKEKEQDTHTENTTYLNSSIAMENKATIVAKKDMYKIVGHWDADVLVGTNGEGISAAEINFHDNTFEGVRRYQFVQDEPGKCRLLVVPATNEFSPEDCQRISQRVASKFGTAIICEIQTVDEIVLTNRGKYKMVIQNLKEKRNGVK